MNVSRRLQEVGSGAFPALIGASAGIHHRGQVFLRCLVIAGVLAYPFQMFSQTDYGSVVGTVSDTSGAYVAGAQVSVTSDATSLIRTTSSESGGSYAVVNLRPGTYTVRVMSGGFREYRRIRVEVTVGGTTRIDAILSLGAVSESIVVNSESNLTIQTDSSSLGGVIEGRQVLESPLNGRNINNLLNFIPGVVPGGGTSGSTIANGGSGNFQVGAQTQAIAYGNYQIGGGFSGQSLFFIDGVLSNVPENNVNSLVPTQDAVQEFRVLTNNADVEFGGFGGGIVQISTKSGSNQYHGTGYEFLRNTVFDANDYFSNRQGLPRPPLHQNQFGGNIGGPLVANRLFGFFSFERETISSGGLATYTVPTAAEASGDFSALGTNIYSPQNGAQYTCHNRLNVICDPDPTAVRLLTLESPLPNRPGLTNNYVAIAPILGAQNQFDSRIDYNPESSDQIFARYTFWNPHNGPSDPLGTKTGSGPTGNTTTEAVIGDNHSLNRSTIADVRISYLQNYNFQVPLSSGFDLSRINTNYAAIQAQQINNRSSGLLPSLDIPNYGIGAQLSQFYWLNTIYGLSGNLTRVRGRHTVKVGGTLRRIKWTAFGVDGGVGLSTLSAFTASSADPTSGNALASFLSGVPSFVYVGEVNTSRAFLSSYGFYASDTYQVGSHLTLNLGLRWDQPSSYSEVNNSDTVLVPQLPTDLGSFLDPVTGTNRTVVGGLAFVASPQHPSRREEELHLRLFAPRIGFASRFNKNTVLHGGYGIAYLPAEITADGPRASAINTFFTELTNTPGTTYVGAPSVGNPFPNGIDAPLGRNPVGLVELLGQGIRSPMSSQAIGYVQQSNLAVEQLLDRATSLTIAYAGAKGTHLVLSQGLQGTGLNLNQLPDQYDAIGGDPVAKTGLFRSVQNPFAGKFISGGPLDQPTTLEGYLLQPYPQYTTVEQTLPRYGSSTYEALQLALARRMAHGGTIQVAYTWSKLISNTDNTSSFEDGQGGEGVVQDNYNLRAEKSLSLQDVTNNLVVNYAVDLPFGRNHLFLNRNSPFVSALVSRWTLNGITTIHSGVPIAFYTNGNMLSNYFGAGLIRPNVLANCARSASGRAQSRVDAWFNTKTNATTGGRGCFYDPGSFQFGNESRVDSYLRSAPARNFDISANKSFPLPGEASGRLGLEVFNVFNRAQFGAPNSNLDDPAFGTITTQANPSRTLQLSLRLSF